MLPPNEKTCSQVTNSLFSPPAYKMNGDPDTVNHVFVSPSSSQILYASVVGNNQPTNTNGWWRSTNGGSSWARMIALGASNTVRRASVPVAYNGQDVFWSVVSGADPPIAGCMTNNEPRMYRTTDSGVTWDLMTSSVDCQGIRSLAVDPGNPNYVALGGVDTYRATNGLAPKTTTIVFSPISFGTDVHADHNGLRFGAGGTLYDGTDGGLWKWTNFSTTPTPTNLNNAGFANIEFYSAGLDALNYTVSLAGTQDNYATKGGAPAIWPVAPGFGSLGDVDGQDIIDPTNSNILYYSTFQTCSLPCVPTTNSIIRSTNGASSWTWIGDPAVNGLPNGGIESPTLAMDPSQGGNTTLVVYSKASGAGTPPGQKVYRTSNANSLATWTSITNDTGLPNNTIPGIRYLTIVPLAGSQSGQSTKVFAAGSTDTGLQAVWCTNDVNRWRGGPGITGHQLPNRVVKNVAVGVRDLTLHQDSRVMRGWTYGRSAWEVQLTNIPRPDLRANWILPVTDVQSAQIGSMSTGQEYAVVWSDDRTGANNWHVFYRSLYNDGTYIDLLDMRVDDTTTHVAQAPAVAPNSSSIAHDLCSWVAWHDDRLDPPPPPQYNHIYYTYICGDGYKPYADMRADDLADITRNATYPALAFQPPTIALEFAAAWQLDRTGGALHDVYARFFSAFGPKAASFRVNAISTSSDATLPVAAADASGNVYIAWNEREPGANEYKVFVSKYDMNGTLLKGPVRVDCPSGSCPNTVRNNVAVAVDGQTGANGPVVILAWWESSGGGPETVFRRRLQFTPGSPGYTFKEASPQQVDDPPSFPAGVKRAMYPSVGTDTSNNFLVTWAGNVNSVPALAGTPLTWSAFGRSFDVNAAVRRKDFRLDLGGRATAGAPSVARVCPANSFAYAWRDNRSGHYDVYTRVAPAW
jgi:hypothetical protein